MTRTIVLGEGRRITLSELSAIFHSNEEVRLVWLQDLPKTGEVSENSFHLTRSLCPPDTSLLPPFATEATLILLSLALCRKDQVSFAVSEITIQQSKQEIAAILVDLVNDGLRGKNLGSQPLLDRESIDREFQLSSDPNIFAKSLIDLIKVKKESSSSSLKTLLLDCVSEEAKPFLARLISLARISLSLAKARALTSRGVSDAIASLSFERLSKKYSLSLDPYSATTFEEMRPHRGCIESAAAMRAYLQRSGNSSTAVTALTTSSGSIENGSSSNCGMYDSLGDDRQKNAIKYTLATPQFHGPSRDAVQTACKTIELEINCSENSNSIHGLWDDTVSILAVRSALDAINKFVFGSTMRTAAGHDSNHHFTINDKKTTESNNLTELACSLEVSVSSLQRALEVEAQLGCHFISEELSQKEADFKAKEAEKAKRAAERQEVGNENPNQSSSKDNEFSGMTEAQKAKILKKRAEKEAKAASKLKAKVDKAAGGEAALMSLFGAGIALIYPLFISSASSSSSLSTAVNLSNPALLTQLEKTMDSLLSRGLQRKPKVPKGTRDYLPEQMSIRNKAFNIIRRVFQRHGAVEIDTPIFELKETLTGKYGEDSKLIYDLADQGGELLALRYDLTVPFARFLAVNSVGNIKRYHIGKVYRRDQPALSRGRYREFYQCDFDIAGVYGRMVPDAECLAVACEILDALPIGDFGIKLNHRRLLDAILDLCGVPSDKFRTICSAVDKLDKEPWSEVKREMVEDKGITEETADKIGEFVVLKGMPWEMYRFLMEGKKFGDHKGALEAMEDMRILFEYLDSMDTLKYISFDLSLARGLDYYTGVIYEAVCMSGNNQVGSIGGGGRYDNLVSMFQEVGKVTPCVGVSVGIERVFTLMEERLRQEQGGSIKHANVAVLVASAGENQIQSRMRLTKVLWDANISAEFNQQENPKLKFEIANALDRDIPYMVIAGEEETKENKCKVKDLKARTEETVYVKDLVMTLRGKGVIPVGCEFAQELLDREKYL